MRFIVDAQLPPVLARWLVGKGHDAEHVMDRQMGAATDTEIWDFAIQASAAIITKDADFPQRKILTQAGFETILPNLLSALERGDTLIEVI